MNWVMALLILSVGSVQAVCKVQKLPDLSPEFSTVAQTLTYAQGAYAELSARYDVEYVGEIRRTSRGFSTVAYKGCRNHDSFRLDVRDRPSLVALWHTHGAPGRLRGYFSTQDAQVVRSLGRPMYLLSTTSTQRVLLPSDVAKPSLRLRAAGSLAARVFGYRGSTVQQSGAISR